MRLDSPALYSRIFGDWTSKKLKLNYPSSSVCADAICRRNSVLLKFELNFFFSPSTYFSRNVSWKRIFGPTTNLVGSTTYMLLKTFKKVCEVPKRLLLKYFLSIWNLIHTIPLFSNKGFMLDEMFEWNTSTFAIFLEYENPCSLLFCFSFHTTLFVALINALVYVDIE